MTYKDKELSHIKYANTIAFIMFIAYTFVRWRHLSSTGGTELVPIFRSSIILVGAALIIAMIFIKKPVQLAVIIPGVMVFGIFFSMLRDNGVPMPFFLVALMALSAVCVTYLQLKSFIIFTIYLNLMVLIFLVVLPNLIASWTHTEANLFIEWILSGLCQLSLYFALHHVSNRQSKSNLAMSSFHTMLYATPNIVAHVDELNRVTYISDELTKLANIENADYAIGRPLLDLFHNPDMSKMIANVLKTEKTYINTANVEMDGEHRHFKIISVEMEGEAKGRLIDITDITPIVQAKNEAEKASQAKSDFLSKMSHEIRTPMNAILGMTEVILREDISKETREQAIVIKQSGSHLLSIINDILDFSKIESGKMEVLKSKYLFHSVVNDVVSIIKMRLSNPDLHFVVYMESDVPNELFGDEVRLRQVMLNLLSNALKYTKKGYFSLDITCEKTDVAAVTLTIKIKDTGIGIKSEDMELLFNEFSQFDLEKNVNIEGTGLGLAITNTLVKLMGGKIEVNSEYGKGSEFIITLEQKCSESEKGLPKEGNKNVLLYCRSPIERQYIERSLQDMEVEYSVATDEHELQLLLLEGNFDFVFVEADLAYTVQSMVRSNKLSTEVVMLSDSYEAFYETDGSDDISVIRMPVYLLPIVNVFSGEQRINSVDSCRHKSFLAPLAKILIVDDIKTNLKVAEGLLKPYEANITLCTSGKEAIEAIKAWDYDLVLMDHMMPEMDGIEAVKIIRNLDLGKENGKYAGLPIVALTANAIVGAKEMFLQNGFNDFLSKPIETAKLNDILAKWIPQEKHEQSLPVTADIADETIIDINIEGVDVKKGMAFSGGSLKDYIETLEIFRKDGTLKIEELENCLESGNISLYTTYIHALKSACANIGADILSGEAKALESAGMKLDLPFIIKHNKGFAESLNKTLEDIGAVILANTEKPDIETLDIYFMKDKLAKLIAALKSFDLDMIDETYEALQAFTQLPDVGDALKDILQNIFLSKYKQAIVQIEEFLDE